MAVGKEQQPTIYQLKVTIKHIRPPIWRRLLVPHDVTLAALHDVLQTAFGWTDSHLHQFIMGREHYALTDPDDFDFGRPTEDERRARLHLVLGGRARKLVYEYDFGDGWEHDIIVEKKLAPDAGIAYPRCTGGRRACPPEDCGGPWGYAGLLDAVGDPDHPEHEAMREWLGDDQFDPEAFDLETVNALLAPRPRRR